MNKIEGFSSVLCILQQVQNGFPLIYLGITYSIIGMEEAAAILEELVLDGFGASSCRALGST